MNTSEVLNLTANLIEERGWTQGPSGWDATVTGSRLCLEGGLLAALGETFVTVKLEAFWSCPAYRAVMQYLGRDETLTLNAFDFHPGPDEPLWQWNDAQTSVDEVIATLRAAAVIEAAKETSAELVTVTA